jgi:hypothetical protein
MTMYISMGSRFLIDDNQQVKLTKTTPAASWLPNILSTTTISNITGLMAVLSKKVETLELASLEERLKVNGSEIARLTRVISLLTDDIDELRDMNMKRDSVSSFELVE